MKKASRFLVFFSLIIILLSLSSCEQFKFDLEGYYAYWTSVARISSSNIEFLAKQGDPARDTACKDKDKIYCISSVGEQELVFDLRNPRNFKLIKTASEILKFSTGSGKNETPLSLNKGTDYTFSMEDTKLKITFTEAFLKKYEWGQYPKGSDKLKTINLTISLKADDGRTFPEYKLSFRVNTAPPTPEIKIAKTADNKRYLLCMLFKKGDFDIWSERHKDLQQLSIANSKNLGQKFEGRDFVTSIKGKTVNDDPKVLQQTDTGSNPHYAEWKTSISTDKYIICYEVPTIKFMTNSNATFRIEFSDIYGLKSLPVGADGVLATGITLTEFYVSSAASDADNPGTDAWPCPTLQAAINKCTGTDAYTIKIKDNLSGDKATALVETGANITSELITIQTDPRESVNKVLDGNDYEIERSLDIKKANVKFKLSKLKFTKYKLALSSFANELTIEDCEFEYNKRAISIAAGTNTLTGVKVSNNTSSGLCAGIRVYKAASISTVPTATLNNCTIKSNTTNAKGGNDEVNNGGGGGLAVVKGATCILTAGTKIMSCTAERGGGVFIGVKDGGYNTTLKMEDATISGNTAHKSGGGIANYCVLTMTGGSITGNFARGKDNNYSDKNKGGGIYFGGAYDSTISGSSIISGNHAYTGAGICITPVKVTLSMTGGVIKDNELHEAGGGLSKGVGKSAYIQNGTFKIANTARVQGDICLGTNNLIPALTINDNYTGGDIHIRPYSYNKYKGQYLAKATTSNEVFKSTILKKIKLSGPSDVSSTHAIDCKGKLKQSDIALDTIKSKEAEMTMSDITIQWDDIKSGGYETIYYKTNLGNYGYMVISDGDTSSITGPDRVGKVSLKFITFYGGCNSMLDQEIYVDSISYRNLDRNDPTQLKADDWDFNWLCENTAPNDIKISPKNGAKFYKVE